MGDMIQNNNTGADVNVNNTKGYDKKLKNQFKQSFKDTKNSFKNIGKAGWKGLKSAGLGIANGAMQLPFKAIQYVVNPFAAAKDATSLLSSGDGKSSSGGIGGMAASFGMGYGMSYFGWKGRDHAMASSSKSAPSKPASSFKATGSKEGITYVLSFELDGIESAEFNSMSPIRMRRDYVSYQEGGVEDAQHIFYKDTNFDSIKLKGIVTYKESGLINWISNNTNVQKKKSCSIILRNSGKKSEDIRRWNLYGVLPISWNMASNKSEGVVYEEIEIAFERVEVVNNNKAVSDHSLPKVESDSYTNKKGEHIYDEGFIMGRDSATEESAKKAKEDSKKQLEKINKSMGGNTV